MHCKGREVLHILRKISAHPDTLIVNNYVFAGPPELVGQRRSSVSRLLVGGQEMAAIASISDLDSEEAAGEEVEEEEEEEARKGHGVCRMAIIITSSSVSASSLDLIVDT